MDSKSRQLLYQSFLEFIGNEARRERQVVNRRMMSVFLWCFLIPALLSLTIVALVKFRILPFQARLSVDWLVLIFPVAYSIYFLGTEVLREVPAAFRRGGVASILIQAMREGEWRERVGAGMETSVQASAEDWDWVIQNFRIDLQAMQYRTRYLTALAGAVFFLIMQGIDSVSGETQSPSSLTFDWGMGGANAISGNLSQFVGLGLFLVLLYLSGSQTYQFLKRFLGCAELILLRKRRVTQADPT